ncbi:MAG: DedA family protein [Gammaproteobacteria bacterium]|nr:DedA family protein [Gammaproteobacteria bacterium]
MDNLDAIRPLLDWITNNSQWSGLVIFLIAASESLVLVGILVPGVVLMLGVGALVGLGILDIWTCIFWATAGAIVGDGFSYWLGYHYHQQLQRTWPLSRYPTLIPRGEAFFRKHGGKSVFLGRFLGPIRAIIPAVAGIMEMPKAKFYIVNVLSAMLWAPVVILPGVVFGASLTAATQAITRIIILLVLLAIIFWLIFILAGKVINVLSLYTRLSRSSLAIMIFIGIVFILSVLGINVFKASSTDDQIALTQAISGNSWWAENWRQMPVLRKGVFYETDSPMTIQWYNNKEKIEQTLSQLGWSKPVSVTLKNVLLLLTPEIALPKRPLVPVFHNWKPPSILFTKYDALGEKLLLFQLWPINIGTKESNKEIWTGNISTVAIKNRFNLFFYPLSEGDYASGLDYLSGVLKSEQQESLLAYKIGIRKLEAKYFTRQQELWTGDVLLISEPALISE